MPSGQPWVGPTTDALLSGEEVYERNRIASTSVTAPSGTLRLTYFTAKKSESITRLTLYSGMTAASLPPTLARAGVYTEDVSGNLTLAAAIPNDTSLYAAADTAYTRTLSSTLNKIRGRRYAMGFLIVSSTTTPSYVGISQTSLAGIFGLAPRLCGVHAGSYSDLPDSVSVGVIANSGSCVFGLMLP